jgi:hypothetical protein
MKNPESGGRPARFKKLKAKANLTKEGRLAKVAGLEILKKVKPCNATKSNHP